MSPNNTHPDMRDLAQRLIDFEAAANYSSGESSPAVVRVSETLRRSLSTLAGGSGFRALLGRAVALAKAQAPSLSAVAVETDGSLQGLSQLPHDQAAEAGVIITAQLLGLLSNFIGEPLMLRLLLDVWPDLKVGETNLGEEKSA